MLRYSVLVTFDVETQSYSVTVPVLPGCATMGDTVDEALGNAREAIEGHVAALRQCGYPVPQETEAPRLVSIELDTAA